MENKIKLTESLRGEELTIRDLVAVMERRGGHIEANKGSVKWEDGE